MRRLGGTRGLMVALVAVLAATVLVLATSAASSSGTAAVVLNTNDSGSGSLRAAIDQVNGDTSTSGPADPIVFAIPSTSTSPIEIALSTPLDAISQAVIIDGSTESSTDSNIPASTPAIYINGATAGANADGLVLQPGSDGSEIANLVIGGFSGYGLDVQSGNVTVRGNYIGTQPDGVTAAANAAGGIFLEGDAALVGQGLRNIVSGNGGSQIHVTGDFNDVDNNYIGLGADGTTVIGGTTGVLIDSGAVSNHIGGNSTSGLGNVIDGFTQDGVLLNGAGTGNVVTGNTIGADTTGTIAPGEGIGIHVTNTDSTVVGDSAVAGGNADSNNGNVIVGETGFAGIDVDDGSSGTGIAGNFIGTDRTGTLTAVGNLTGVAIEGANSNTVGPGNDIAWNEGNGVAVGSSTGVRIVANSIHDNGVGVANSLGIAVDSESSPLIPPAIASSSKAGTTTVVGTIDEPLEPNTPFYVELFGNGPTCDTTGEGAGYLGFAPATTDGNGHASFSAAVGSVGLGDTITATATSASSGATSEFSACATVTAEGNGAGGSITGSVVDPAPGWMQGSTPQPPINLTSVGTDDWAIWGSAGGGTSVSPAPDEHKATGSGIGNLTDINPANLADAPVGYFTTANPLSFSWSDGTAPTPVDPGPVYGGISHTHPTGVSSVDAGYSFTVPASTTPRRLVVYVYAHGGVGRLVAQLSDGSAPDFVDASNIDPSVIKSTFNTPAIYTLDYAAASTGQTLTVSWVLNTLSSGGNEPFSNAAVYAAALTTVAQPTLTTTASPPTTVGATISDSATLSGATPDATGSITFKAYSDNTCTTLVDTESATVSGNGDYSIPGFQATTVGAYYWTATYSGDSGNAAVNEDCNGANESTTVTEGNDAWTQAQQIDLPGGTGSAQGSLDLSGQAAWYKFKVTPGSTVQVDLSNLPANYDLAVFSDISQAFNDLSSPNALQTLSAESGNDAFSPSVFSPSVFSPSVFSPSVFSPSVFSPSVFSPSVFSPSVFSPSVFSPSVFSPSVFSPSVFSPSVFSPSVFSPDPSIYEGAQTRSLIAISANDGTASEHVFADVWNNTGSFYIRVNGRNGTYDPGAQFTVNVQENSGACGGVVDDTADTDLTSGAVPPGLGSPQTLILTNEDRMSGDLTAMNTALGTLAALPSVNGTIVDVDSASKRVKALNLQADANTGCAYAKNLVAGAIRDIVTDYRATYPSLKYIVVVGDDNTIPFFRYPDTAGIGPESNYVPPVLDTSASQASLQSDDILSQDAYGATTVLHLKGLDLPVPDLPVGRLVKTPAEITGLLNDYIGLSGGVVPTPTSSLVTGYDFMASGATAVEGDLSAGLGSGATNDTLITNQGVAPSNTGTPPTQSWTAAQLQTDLLGSRHDLIFLAGHFSANNTLAADYSTTLNATALASSTVNLKNSIVFSAGCHSGYSIVNSDAVPGVTQTLDWTEAFAGKGATLIAGTGYQYGDTDFLAYSEQLYANFAHDLRLGSGPVAVGAALVDAKQNYLTATANLQGIDIKSILESTLYGLPMLSVNMPGSRVPTTADPSIVGSTTPFSSGPGAAAPPGLGLSSADVTLSPSLGPPKSQALVDPTGNLLGISATYFTGPNGVETSPGAPTLPLAASNVSVSGSVLRGVGFLGGSYSDTPSITPLTGAPATELNGVHSPFISSAFYPSRLWTVNYFGGLTNDPASTLIDLTPVQYKSDALGSSTDIQRQFSNVKLRLFYSHNTTTYAQTGGGGTNTPALAAPPTISRVDATAALDGSPAGTSTVTFNVQVVGDPSAGIQDAWTTYAGDPAGQWNSLDLTQSATDSRLWSGSLTNVTTSELNALQFVVQAVNGVGLVSLDDNEGAYYRPGQIPPALQAASTSLTTTSLQLGASPTGGSFGSPASVSATLKAGLLPISGEQVTFSVGGSSVSAQTNLSGFATAQLPLVDLPGPYQLTAGFNGDTVYAGSSASSAFTIATLPTSLVLSGGGSSAIAGTSTGISASLKSTLVGLSQRTVAFVLSPTGGSTPITQTAITDLNGKASLGVVSQLTPGTYNVSAYFATTGAPITLPSDPIYQGSSATAVPLTVVAAPTVSSINLVGNTPTNATSVSWKVIFSKAVTGVSAANFSLVTTGVTGAGSIGVTGSGTTYTVTASTGSGNGTIGLNLSVVTGIPGLVAPFPGQVVTIDKTAPTVTSINLAGTSPTNASSLAWTVTFSEPVSNVVAADFTAVGAGLTGGTGLTIATPVATGGAPSASWTVTVATHGAAGANSGSSVKLNLTNVGTIQDPATNRLAATRNGDQSYTYDTTAPTVTNVTSTLANGSYKAGQVVPITVTFSEPVNVVGTPQLTLALTPANRAVNYTGGTGTSTLTFTYTVLAGDTSADLNYATTTALALTGGTIRDAATNNATLTLPGLTATGSLGTNKAIVINTTAPKVLSINLGAASPTTATSVSWKITFSESVTGVKATSFSLAQTGLTGAGGIAVTGSGASYTVTATTGTGTGTIGLNLTTPAGIVDAAGNALTGTFTGQVYTVAAKLSSGTTTCNGIYMGVGANVTVPTNGSCTLLPGTAVGSNVTVGTGGTLSMFGVLVGNNVQATGAAGIGITASAIGHDIQIAGTKGKGPGGADNFICQTAVAHDLVVQGGASTASKFVIGGAPDCLGGNTMGHDLVVQTNQNAVVVNGNVAGHDVTILTNTPGGAAITNNTAAVDSACSGNNPQTGSGNKGTHSNTCPR